MRLFNRSGLVLGGSLVVPKAMPRRRMPPPCALPTVIATTPWSRFVHRLLHLAGRL
jgi:hypothetical protein